LVKAGGAVDAGLKRVALSAAQPLRQVPVGAAAGKRDADDAIRGEAIVEAARETCGIGGEIMGADHRGIA
jgi:hypothetical protein